MRVKDHCKNSHLTLISRLATISTQLHQLRFCPVVGDSVDIAVIRAALFGSQ